MILKMEVKFCVSIKVRPQSSATWAHYKQNPDPLESAQNQSLINQERIGALAGDFLKAFMCRKMDRSRSHG